LPTKKQDKYNPTRWAVAGRNNSALNTKCYQIFYKLKEISETLSAHELDLFYEKINFCWSSDFRTNTTEGKYFNCLFERDRYLRSLGLYQQMDLMALVLKKFYYRHRKN
jgi:hypothetical protein